MVVHNKAIRFKIFIPLFQLKYLHPVEELYSIKNLTFIKNEKLTLEMKIKVKIK